MSNGLRAAPLQAARLELWARIVCGVLGLAGLGAGATAVFVTDVEAGPAALLLAGLVLIVIALSGALPSSLKMGDNEVKFGAAGGVLDQTLERAGVSTGEKAAIVGQLDEAGAPPELTAPIRSSVAFEESTARLVTDIVDRGAGNMTVHPSMGPEQRSSPDLALNRSDGRIVFVDIVRQWPADTPGVMAAKLAVRCGILRSVNSGFAGLLYLCENVPSVWLAQTQDVIAGSPDLADLVRIIDMGHQMAGVLLEQTLRYFGDRAIAADVQAS